MAYDPLEEKRQAQNQNEIEDETVQTPDESGEEEVNRILYGAEYEAYRDSLGEAETAEDPLSTFRGTNQPTSAGKAQTASRKKLVITLVCAAVLAVFTVLFFVLGPYGIDVFGFRQETEENEMTLLDEIEAIGPGNRYLLFAHVPRENVQSIEVHNEHGTYTAYYHKGDEVFYYLGAEAIPYDQEKLAKLIVSAGYTLAQTRLEAEKTGDLSVYGLSEKDDPAYYILTSRDGKSYKVYIGVPTMEDTGYYARFEGRDAVYILSSDIADSLLADFRDMLTPLLTYPLQSTNDYLNIRSIDLAKDGKFFLRVKYTGDDAGYEEEYGSRNTYLITYPQEYYISTNNFSEVLQKISVIVGDRILAYNVYRDVSDGIDEETGEEEFYSELIPEIAEKYALSENVTQLAYILGDYATMLEISEKQTDEETGEEFYYVASMIYGTIARVPAASLDFLEWNLIDFVRKEIFLVHIDKVSSIEVITSDRHYDFLLTGTGSNLSVMERNERRGYSPDVTYFRRFYGSLVSIFNEDFTEEPSEDTRALLLEFVVTLRSGKVLHYKFYAYSERRCYYTLNDEGQFYVLRSSVREIAENAQKLIDGEEIAR